MTDTPLNDDEVRMLLDYVTASRKVLDALAPVLADLHLTYDSSVPNDARLAVGTIGSVAISDLRSLDRYARKARKLLGKRRAVTGIKIVTLAYEERGTS